MKPYVYKADDRWAWGCWDCNWRKVQGTHWRYAVHRALMHLWVAHG